MKQRFVTEKRNCYLKNLLISLAGFAVIFMVFWAAVSSVSVRTEGEELRTLETAVNRGITHCYAIEGTYPASLEYLKEHYGLLYNEEKYFIDYQPLGSNIMPDITIIKRGKERRL